MSADTRVRIVDYGAGNMFSILHAVRAAGGDPVLVKDADEWDATSSSSAILPGVGAFGGGMEMLRERGLRDRLIAHSQANRPLLGVCLGAQLMLDESTEFGEHAGLGIIPGQVLPFDSGQVRVPHIGWARVEITGQSDGRLFAGIEPQAWMYFVHSFYLAPAAPSHVHATSRLGSISFSSAIGSGRAFGVQFHPEKSGNAGLRLLHNFIQIGTDHD